MPVGDVRYRFGQRRFDRGRRDRRLRVRGRAFPDSAAERLASSTEF
jgi:hypothetical protein